MTVTGNIIKADEGKMLTNGSAYGSVVHLGDWDKPENWHEVSKEEYESVIEQNNNEPL